MSTTVFRHSIAIGELIPGDVAQTLAVEITLPEPAALAALPVVLFCFPGGAMNKTYFNLLLDGEEDAERFNFARQLARRGCISIAIDHLGVGESSRPRDGFALTPDLVVAANQRAVAQLQTMLRDGTLSAALPPLPRFRSIGVGHSMGAMLTAMQQAEHRSFEAVAILGFSTRGLPDYVTDEIRQYVNNPTLLRADLARLARARGDDPYPELNTRGQAREIYGGGADKRALQALGAARSNLLAMMGLMAMMPGSVAPECARIEVPVLLGLGDRDMAGPPHAIPASFSASRDVTLLVLPDMGHTHFAFPSCTRLFERLARWLDEIA